MITEWTTDSTTGHARVAAFECQYFWFVVAEVDASFLNEPCEECYSKFCHSFARDSRRWNSSRSGECQRKHRCRSVLGPRCSSVDLGAALHCHAPQHTLRTTRRSRKWFFTSFFLFSPRVIRMSQSSVEMRRKRQGTDNRTLLWSAAEAARTHLEGRLAGRPNCKKATKRRKRAD